MKKIISILLLAVSSVTAINAQTKATVPGLPDVNKMMQMTPAEREEYKKQMLSQASKRVKEISQASNIKIDESVLPDYELKLPERDVARIALISKQILTLSELVASVKKSKDILASVTPQFVLDGIKKMVATQNPAQLQSSSIMEWYANNPVAALLLSMESAIEKPDSVIVWNNLSAFFNMCGLEHKSIPILKHWLEKLPQNSLLLNNMGQAWLGLGDIPTAEDYLKQCLAEDSLNPEANRSMAFICIKKNEPEKAKEYTKKEQQIATRVSTTIQVEKKIEPLDLYIIHAKNPRIPKEKYYESIGLSKFELPPMPQNTGEVPECKRKWEAFTKSISDELIFWQGEAATPLSEEELRRERYETGSIYWKKSERLYNDLKNNYADILPLFNTADLARNLNSAQAFAKEYYGVCYDPSGELTTAKCCAKKRPIANKYLKEHNEFVKERATRAMTVWKSYIDGVINIIMLDPSARNKRFVDQHLVLYFSMLAQVAGAVSFENPVECESINLSDEELGALIKSSRAINFQCPSWLNIEFDLQVAKLKADCEKFEVEVGKGLIGAFEKNFKTGSSTISAGVGASQNFVAGKAKLKQMVYVTFDNDNQFSDMGVKGTAEVSVSTDPVQIAGGISKVTGKIAGVEGGYTWGVNSGFQTSLKGKGIISNLKITHKF